MPLPDCVSLSHCLVAETFSHTSVKKYGDKILYCTASFLFILPDKFYRTDQYVLHIYIGLCESSYSLAGVLRGKMLVGNII